MTSTSSGEHLHLLPESSVDTSVPPNYHSWHVAEMNLPQHDVNLPAPQGKEGRYLMMNNHIWGIGWGNVLQELIFNAHLAYRTNRTFVFYNYTWSVDPGDIAMYNDKPIPARIPITALLSGPIAGAPFPPAEKLPPAVSTEFYRQVCQNSTRLRKDVMGTSLQDASASVIVQAWVDRISQVDDPCLEFEGDQLFDVWLFGDGQRMLDIWPSLSQSPIITEFAWSPLILSAVETNRDLVHPAVARDPKHRAPLPGLLAMHVRRGDFVDHCMHFANWSSQYNAFNSFPQFPDRFTPPEGGGWGINTPENYAKYMDRCFPDIPSIVKRVMEIKASATGRQLDRIYVLTNGPREWLAELKEALRRAATWKSITTSRDMRLSWEQKFVAQAVDMQIAQQADVFIGNGFSSLTSNVNMFRMAYGLPPEKTRFW
ncbi:hypothetical protein BV25DRAFT_1913261 [Artomyces pyxidatus]|uniref:Uncharacterized protein n=1 Tax=Artomyces pyxidatus TaxID=48021 RepID=A0ACB8TCW6_9AGAM|nr:hypothetical protein BV25DRAFT_1913261 [Artomyces pyxidatus]